jgi:hypothetical protein
LGETNYSTWGNLLHSVKTGEIAFGQLFGMNVWQYHAQHPQEAQIFAGDYCLGSCQLKLFLLMSLSTAALGNGIRVNPQPRSVIRN